MVEKIPISSNMHGDISLLNIYWGVAVIEDISLLATLKFEFK